MCLNKFFEINNFWLCDWIVRRMVVSLTHQDSSRRLDIAARIVLNLFQTSTKVRSVGGDVPPIKGSNRGRVCMCAFIGVSVCACI